jgi:hypothetical protein
VIWRKGSRCTSDEGWWRMTGRALDYELIVIGSGFDRGMAVEGRVRA